MAPTPSSAANSSDAFQDIFNYDYIDLYLKLPERKLWLAVIGRAWHDIEFYQEAYSKGHPSKENYLHAINAQLWLTSHSTEKASYLWTVAVIFPSCCLSRALSKIAVFAKQEIKHPLHCATIF